MISGLWNNATMPNLPLFSGLCCVVICYETYNSNYILSPSFWILLLDELALHVRLRSIDVILILYTCMIYSPSK
jgi:hypothetical protein